MLLAKVIYGHTIHWAVLVDNVANFCSFLRFDCEYEYAEHENTHAIFNESHEICSLSN